MKHSKYIATIAAGSIFFSSMSPSVFALDMGNYMSGNVGSFINNASSMNETSGSTDSNNNDDENIANTDMFSVKTHEIKKGNLSIGNTNTIEIDGNLYVYGNLDVSNADSFKVTGKLKVTWDLIVGNGDLENTGRIYVGGKKKFSNGSMRGTGAMVTTDFAKYDPILRADLDKEEEATVQDMITTLKKKVDALKLEIKAATEKKERIEPIKDKIRHEKEVFFHEMKTFIQEEDMSKFENIEKDDSSATENFLISFKHTGEPSAKLRQQIEAIVAKIFPEKRESRLTMLVAKLEAMLETKLSDKRKSLISQVKEALQDELDNLAEDDTIDGILNGNAPALTSTESTNSGTANTASGDGTTQTTAIVSNSGSGAMKSTSSGSGALMVQ